MIELKDITPIGKFQKTHALKGELNAIIDVDPDFFSEGNSVIVEQDGIYVPFFASSIRSKGSTSYLVKLDGIDCEKEAKKFVNKTAYASKKQLAPFLNLQEDEIMDDSELIGYEVFDQDLDHLIGKIINIDSSTSNFLFIIETKDGKEVFIPAVEEFINEINDNEKLIVMNLPSGLLDLN